MVKTRDMRTAIVLSLVLALLAYGYMSPDIRKLFSGVGLGATTDAAIVNIDGFGNPGTYFADIQYVDGTHATVYTTNGKIHFKPRMYSKDWSGFSTSTPSGSFAVVINSVALSSKPLTNFFTVSGKPTCTSMKYESCIGWGYQNNGMVVAQESGDLQWYMPYERTTNPRGGVSTTETNFIPVSANPACPGYESCYGACNGRSTSYCGWQASNTCW